MSQETHAAQWLGFRQPVLRVAREKRGETIDATYEANPGEVWEESEFWAALTWRIDPDGSLGIRKHFESPYRPGEPVTMDEYYGWMFENSVPGLPEAAAQRSADAARLHAASTACSRSRTTSTRPYEAPLPAEALAGADDRSSEDVVLQGRHADRRRSSTACALAGFTTPSRRLEFRSQTLVDWGWPEHAVPRYVPGHVHWRDLKREAGRVRSAAELPAADAHPHAIAGEVAVRDLARQPAVDRDRRTRGATASRRAISSRCARASATSSRARGSPKGSAPASLGMSHHLGRWRLHEEMGNRTASALVTIDRRGQRLQGVAGPRRAAVHERRSRQLAHLVERGRRAPEPHVPGAARPGERHALLAPARDAREGRARRSLRRHLRRHRRSRTRSTRSGWR